MKRHQDEGVNGLALRSTVRELVTGFASAEQDIRSAFAILVSVEGRLNAAFALADHRRTMRVDASSYGYHDQFDKPDNAIMRLRRQAWIAIVDRLEIRRAMSIQREKELSKQLDEWDPPELTEDNVMALGKQYATDLASMWGEAVKEVFDWLRPREHSYRAAAYKTNKKNAFEELGPKIILTNVVDGAWLKPGFRIDDWSAQRFLALDNVFSGLDGHGTIAKTHYGPLGDAIAASGKEGVGETPYFAFKCFRNKNLHLTFKRLDLLARLNQIAGGMRLKPDQREDSNAAQ